MGVIGSYPVPPENYIWWKNRWQVPGGQITQQVSPFQLKIMWQYFYNNPSKWYWRFSNWMWPVLMPAFMFYVLWQKVKADAEERFASTRGIEQGMKKYVATSRPGCGFSSVVRSAGFTQPSCLAITA